tara:strand:+ start:134 stop:703 length:570 start_codon:yes stop_codon:yes gene_type:complete
MEKLMVNRVNKIIIDNLQFKKYISNESIEKRIDELSKDLNFHYLNRKPLVIGILNGSIYFMMDILKKVDFEYSIDFIKASSYKGLNSEDLEVDKIFKKKYKNKRLLIIEDIIDTGKTINKIYKQLMDCDPKEIKIITLLDKNTKKRNINFEINLSGFEIIDKYVIGYGMDYNNLFRYLKDIYIQDEEEK